MSASTGGAAPPIRWHVRRSPAGADLDPATLPDDGWLPATVPGSLAATPQVAATYGPQALADADHAAWWWRGELTLAAPLPDAQLVLDRLTTHADVHVDGIRVLRSDNAFRRHVVDVGDLTAGPHEVAVRIASFDETPVPRRPRPRWRSSLVPDATLRWRRTPLLGRIPTWEGALPPVGILGAVTLRARPRVEVVALQTGAEQRGEGWLGTLSLHLRAQAGAEPLDDTRVTLDGVALPASWSPAEDGVQHLRLRHEGRHAALWWPHTHGEPTLHHLRVEVAGETVLDRRVGWSRTEARRDDGRFALVVNGVDVFVRGAVWTMTDPRGWVSDRGQVARDLDALAGAGLNLLRVPGTGTYADDVLRELAAERGLLVWQDAMLATFDPPEDPAWLAELEAELVDQLTPWQGWPHLAVVCGGTETEQQPTLLGLPASRRRMTAVHDLLPRLARELAPGAVHVTSSPSGGPRPVSLQHGVSHYFGVGAYQRPLEDARTAPVSFASEALAFGIPPEASGLDALGAPDDRGPGSDWRRAAPHDRGAGWDFVDVTDHYVPAVADPARVHADRDEQERWEDLQRLAATTAITQTFAVWRSSLTPTAGGIVLAHRDLAPGPGWGLLDAAGAPKAPLLALRDVLAPVALLLVDRGLDGIVLEAVNDTSEPVSGTLLLAAQDRHGSTVLDATRELAVPPRGRVQVEVEEELGGFRDLGWSWRFAPEPAYSLLRATWRTAHGDVTAARLLVPVPTGSAEPDLSAVARRHGPAVHVDVTAIGPGVAGVHAHLPGWRADTGWWPLAQGDTRRLVLRPERPDNPDNPDKPDNHGGPRPASVVVASLTGAPLRVPVEADRDTD
ncbi:glycosyl hydrolase 2 galactose-binding domain-containing protein [Arsenicicoccus sp. oral taxon 190]|uniref:glycosyl hydrolase 2 galactose-binding domain-containing protein n=1 Tax=Arsenicicoccus sp. oral taxon 190 TaxID=1658671 RepID=UPI00067DA1D6|nr:hypothetical protein [Arsenicicoccus sp. oral taxon 190]